MVADAQVANASANGDGAAAARRAPSADETSKAGRADPILAALSILLLYMVCWIFMFPASSWNGWLPGHERLMVWIAEHDFVAAPRDIASKHGPHAAVKLTHILPSGVWCLCGAMQLAPPRLRAAAPRLHRLTGRVMLATAVPVAIGYYVMEARGLVGGTHELHGSGHHGRGTPDNRLPLRGLNAWFVLTAVAAVVQARRRRFASHGAWALRHIASGVWVVVQRVMVSAVSGVAMVAGVKWSEEARYDVFGKIAVAAIVACVVGAEVYVRTGSGDRLRPAARLGAEVATLKAGARAGSLGEGEGMAEADGIDGAGNSSGGATVVRDKAGGSAGKGGLARRQKRGQDNVAAGAAGDK